MYTALIVLYALTAGIAGYTAGSYYKQMGGTAWVRGRRRRGPAGPAVHTCRLAEARARARAGAQHAADMHRVLRPVLRRLLRQQHHCDRIRGAPRRRPPPVHAGPRLVLVSTCARARSRPRRSPLARSSSSRSSGAPVSAMSARPSPPVGGPDARAGRALVTIPLTILGCIIGKNTRTEFKAPCRTTKCARAAPASAAGAGMGTMRPGLARARAPGAGTRGRCRTCRGTAARCRRCSSRVRPARRMAAPVTGRSGAPTRAPPQASCPSARST